MAGLYPDIPGTRFALDQDGSVLKWRNFTTGSSWTDITGSIANILNANTTANIDLGISAPAGEEIQLAVAFPEPRSVNGVYLHAAIDRSDYPVDGYVWESSTDTTDGTNGTWSTFNPSFTLEDSHDQTTELSKPFYRSDIANLALTNITGIRVRYNRTAGGASYGRIIYTLHVYGSRPSTGVDRLAFWDPSSDIVASPALLDFGDHAQGTVTTRQVRVKNLSGGLTANSITVSTQDIAAEFGANLQVSTDDSTYASSINIGNLAPGAISSVFYVRRTVPPAATETQRSGQILANAGSWT